MRSMRNVDRKYIQKILLRSVTHTPLLRSNLVDTESQNRIARLLLKMESQITSQF
jgi:hypothetical protein